MKKQVSHFWQQHHLSIALIAGLAGLVYLIVQAVSFAERLPTIVWDESMYLYKGYLFAAGRYTPFEDFGPWTNQLPVSFLIPGYVQEWFGPGMRTSRTYAVVVGALAALGLWLTMRRNAGPWWAAAAVWTLALNPTYVQVFSQSFAQTLVSMLFAWMLFFGLGAKRQDWELILAAFMAGLAGMARVNVLPALPLLILYVFWQHGSRPGFKALAAGLLPVVFFHVLYWPEILKFWAYWIPPEIFSAIEPFRSPWQEIFLPPDFAWFPLSRWTNDPASLQWIGIRAFWQSIRVNFVIFFGLLTAAFLYRRGAGGKADSESRQVVAFSPEKELAYLAVSFFILYAVHLYAANGRGCQFVCLPGYIMFFFMFGFVLIGRSASFWRLDQPAWKQVLMVVLVLALLLALEYNFNSDYLDFRYDLIRNTFDIEIPRLKDGRIVEGTGLLWELLENKFGYDHFPLRQFILHTETAVHLVRWIKMAGLVLLAAPLLYRVLRRRVGLRLGFGVFVLVFVLGYGLLASGSRLFGRHLTMEACQDSVIASYEQVGAELADLIPPGSQVYWDVKADMLLLYLPEVETFTPQLNATFTYVDDPTADPETLFRFGWWNPVLKERWVQEADYILVENRFFDEEWQARLEAGEVEQILLTEPVASCRGDDARIVVLVPTP